MHSKRKQPTISNNFSLEENFVLKHPPPIRHTFPTFSTRKSEKKIPRRNSHRSNSNIRQIRIHWAKKKDTEKGGNFTNRTPYTISSRIQITADIVDIIRRKI